MPRIFLGGVYDGVFGGQFRGIVAAADILADLVGEIGVNNAGLRLAGNLTTGIVVENNLTSISDPALDVLSTSTDVVAGDFTASNNVYSGGAGRAMAGRALRKSLILALSMQRMAIIG